MATLQDITGLAPNKPMRSIQDVPMRPQRRAGEQMSTYRSRNDVQDHMYGSLPKMKTFTVDRGWPIRVDKEGTVVLTRRRRFSVTAVHARDAAAIVQRRIDRQIDHLRGKGKAA